MDKLRQRQEIQAYRIVRRNVLKITNGIPLANLGKFTFEALVNSNVTISQIKEMFLEIYTTLGKPQYKRSQKDGIDFEAIIAKWLNDNAGLRIISVHETLIQSIVNVIAQGYEDNISVADITRNLQRQFGWYKYQALRIARTETTTATNYATVLASQNSEYVQVKKWISVQDNRTRRPPHSIYDHLDMNGVTVDAESPFFVGGENIEFPGDPRAKAGNTINCRCKVVYLLKEDEDGLPIRKGADKYPKIPKLNIKAVGFENVGFDAHTHAMNKAKEFGVTGDIIMFNNPKSKFQGGGTGWKKDENGIYGNNGKIDVEGNLTDDQVKEVINHEMRHIMQMQTKQFEFKGGFYYWNGQKHISSDTYKKYINGMSRAKTQEKRYYYYKKYKDTPWEADAHAHGDPFNKNKSIMETKPADILEPAEWNDEIPLNEMTILDLEVLNENN